MTKILILSFSILLSSCATNFNKTKRIKSHIYLNQTILKQDGKFIDKTQVYDQIGRKSDRTELEKLKKEYTLVFGTAGVGAGILGWGIIQENNTNMILVGGALVGAAFYYALQGDKKLAPYIENHNRSINRSSLFPQFFINPSDSTVVSGLGYNIGF